MEDPHIVARKTALCLESVAAIEALLPMPAGAPGRTDRIAALARSAAYHAPNRAAMDLARKVGSEAADPDSRRLSDYVSRLRAELEASGRSA